LESERSISSKLVNVTWEQWHSIGMDGINKSFYETWAKRDDVRAAIGTAPTWDEFKKTPILALPLPKGDHTPVVPFTDQIQKGQPFTTPSGKIELYSTYLATADLRSDWFRRLDRAYAYMDPTME